ncbi:ChaN family lipoprotein [Pseudorhodobacter ferrugineus]|uniref:ChaN family lipoprotein n=1 Tax=Pseudorhodobacter ferrugineus TaxID=77008 RepID=UPI0003B75661|nr:ChaN family lipoprotein [Pseudorhodobacter ferrugineus]
MIKAISFLSAMSLLCGDMAFAQKTTLADLPATAPAEIVILGEIHDNPTHHLTQADLVARWKPAAIVFEMLTPSQAKAVGGTDRTDATAMEAALQWNGTGWPDYDLYHPIFAASGTANLYGAALDISDVRRAITEGAATVFGPDASLYGLATPLPAAEQSAREADQMTAHCNALPPEMLAGMVAAQRLRDAAFARTALAALAEAGGPVVVITGSGHADRDRGIPAALAIAAPDTSVYSIGQIEGAPDPSAPFDVWIVTPPTPRDDPCVGFAKP